VPTPPLTTLKIGPATLPASPMAELYALATAPDSKAPSSLEHSMKTVLTAPTRPRR